MMGSFPKLYFCHCFKCVLTLHLFDWYHEWLFLVSHQYIDLLQDKMTQRDGSMHEGVSFQAHHRPQDVNKPCKYFVCVNL